MSDAAAETTRVPQEYWVSVNGELIAPDRAVVSIFDHGFIYGDSVYEALRTHGGRLFGVAPHWERLVASARALSLELPFDRAGFTRILEDVVAARPGDCEVGIRIMISRGSGPLGLSFEECGPPTVVAIAWPIPPGPHPQATTGIPVVLSQWRRVPPEAFDAGIKSGNYLNNAMAYQDARRRGAFEAIMLATDGTVAEATTSNVFWVRSGTLHTPVDRGILRGVTRACVIELAERLGIPLDIGRYPKEDLLAADEVFITSTLKGVLPVHTIDDTKIGPAGPVTLRLQQAYLDEAQRG